MVILYTREVLLSRRALGEELRPLALNHAVGALKWGVVDPSLLNIRRIFFDEAKHRLEVRTRQLFLSKRHDSNSFPPSTPPAHSSTPKSLF